MLKRDLTIWVPVGHRVVIIITTLAEHRCSTKSSVLIGETVNQMNSKSTQIKSNVGFEERGKLEYPEKNLSEQTREPTSSAHLWLRDGESNTLVEEERSYHCANPVSHSPGRPWRFIYTHWLRGMVSEIVLNLNQTDAESTADKYLAYNLELPTGKQPL